MSVSEPLSQNGLLDFHMPVAGWSLMLLLHSLLLLSIYQRHVGPHLFSEISLLVTAQKHVKDLKSLYPYIRAQSSSDARQTYILLGVTGLCVVAGRIINVVSPLIYRRVVDQLSTSSSFTSPPHHDGNERYFPWLELSSFVLLRYMLVHVVHFAQWAIRRRFENMIECRIMVIVYDKIMTLSADYHDNKNSSDAWKTVLASGAAVTNLVSAICFRIVPDVLDLVLGAVSFASVCGTQQASVMVAVLAVYLVFLVRASVVSDAESKLDKEWGEAIEKRDTVSSGTIPNWWTVMLFGRLAHEKHRHAEAVDHYRTVDMAYCENQWLSYNSKYLVEAFGVLLLCLLVSRDIFYGSRSPGDLVMFIQLWAGFVGPVQSIVQWKDKASSLEMDRLLEILHQEPSIKDKAEASDLKLQTGNIVFHNVSFAYKDNDRPAVQDVHSR